MKKRSAFWRAACKRLRDVKDFHFTEGEFKPRAALQSIETESGSIMVKPYEGERFDETKWEIVEDMWDHEHCALCSEAIYEADTCWSNQHGRAICPGCHELFKELIELKGQNQAPTEGRESSRSFWREYPQQSGDIDSNS